MPAVLAPLIIRKPGAALFAEMVAAGVSAFLGSQWGVDTLLSGFVQGAAAELVFAFTLYRVVDVPGPAIAAVASAPRPPGSTTGSSTTRRLDPTIQIIRGCRHGDLGGRHRGRRFGRCSIAALQRPACSKDSPTDAPTVARGSWRPATSRSAIAARPAGPRRHHVRAAGRAATMLVARAVGLGQEHAGARHRRPDPARDPGDDGRALSLDGREIRGPAARRGGGAGRDGLAGPGQPARHGAGRGRRRVRAREPRLAARCDAGASPRSAGEIGLDGLRTAALAPLSGGQQQRLALAGVARAASPDILVLDEPTANLDPAGAAAFMSASPRCAPSGRRRSSSIEHLVEAAWPMADLVLALDDDGRPIDVGTPLRSRDARRRGCATPGSGSGRRRAGIRGGPAARPTVGAGRTPPRAGPSSRPPTCASGSTAAEPVIRDVEPCGSEAGERVALVGPNGSGKSTLARLLVGLLRPDMRRGPAARRRSRAAAAGRAGSARRHVRLPGSGAPVPGPDRRGGGPARAAVRGARLGARCCMGRLGLPLDRIRATQPVSAVGRGAAAAVARLRAGPRARGARPR